MALGDKPLHQQPQARSVIVHDDTYGIETEADLIAAAEAAFLEYDAAEQS